MLKILRILSHAPVNMVLLGLLDLLDLLPPSPLHLLSDVPHAQRVLLLQVASLAVVFFAQSHDLLVLLELESPNEAILRDLHLLSVHLHGTLVLLQLRLSHTVLVLLQLECSLGIGLELHDLILFVIPKMLQTLLKHLDFNLLPLLQILQLTGLVSQLGLLLLKGLFLHDPKIIDLLALLEEEIELLLLRVARHFQALDTDHQLASVGFSSSLLCSLLEGLLVLTSALLLPLLAHADRRVLD
mmetsp:Transcript_42255/g.92169  ORF Transcript_42255/g.92169 Transcript_42255/m.92169 type:complete len:242 (-) Transcript_42255:11-736(-)